MLPSESEKKQIFVKAGLTSLHRYLFFLIKAYAIFTTLRSVSKLV